MNLRLLFAEAFGVVGLTVLNAVMPPVPKHIPQQRPPEPSTIPGPRVPLEDRLHRVGLCAALRASSEDAIEDWKGWQAELDEAPMVTALVRRMEERFDRGEGW